MKAPDLDRDQILFMLDKLRTGDIKDQRYQIQIVETFLNSVYLYDDGKAVLHLNFTGDKKTVTLEYTENAIEHAEPMKSSTKDSSALPYESKTNFPVYISGLKVSIIASI